MAAVAVVSFWYCDASPVKESDRGGLVPCSDKFGTLCPVRASKVERYRVVHLPVRSWIACTYKSIR